MQADVGDARVRRCCGDSSIPLSTNPTVLLLLTPIRECILPTTMNRMAKGHRAWAMAIVGLMLTQTAGWPWGRTGHRVSAIMAESRLTPTALAAVRSLLESGKSLADASTWADEQREVRGIGP